MTIVYWPLAADAMKLSAGKPAQCVGAAGVPRWVQKPAPYPYSSAL